ncbi:MAG: hypothetical protein DCF28_05255 [Alphaproteobacteria bacterium]|nr:MAG: hypothetical protein DCF28_05255 [Alphaproteobacteria bacterium]
MGFGSIIAISPTKIISLRESLGDPVAIQALNGLICNIKSLFDEDAHVACFNDDCFFVWTRNFSHRKFSVLGSAMRDLLDKEIDVEDVQVKLLNAVGVVFLTVDCKDPYEALRRARVAVSAAKCEPSRLAVFNPHFDSVGKSKALLDADLRSAIMSKSLHMVYQPQFNAKNEIVGVEALMRWNHPERGMISPSIFVSIAEQGGYSDELDSFALDCALRDAANWPNLTVAINISPLQLRTANFCDEFERLCRFHRATPKFIEIEITEGVLVDQNPWVLINIKRLRSQGFKFAIDDFGTGYSNLGYLNRLPIDKLKIDQSFISGLGKQNDAISVLRAIISLAESMDIRVIAEGVETEEQFQILKTEGCEYFQGYLFGRPSSVDSIRDQISRCDGLVSPVPQSHILSDYSAKLESRRMKRVRSVIPCTISFGAFGEKSNGVVRDIHRYGARVRPSCSAMAVSDPVELRFDNELFLAKIAWRNDREIGLRFLNSGITNEDPESGPEYIDVFKG